jgi:CheY-like chemotaxis protein
MGIEFGVEFDNQAARSPTAQDPIDTPPDPRPSGPGAPVDSPSALTILLADDEPILLRVLTRQLERDGHAVLGAVDGQHALSIARGYQGELHVLVTDIVMPNMGGMELAFAIRESRPGTRVIFMSGYAPDAATRERLTSKNATFLAKPFSFDVLRTALKGGR